MVKISIFFRVLACTVLSRWYQNSIQSQFSPLQILLTSFRNVHFNMFLPNFESEGLTECFALARSRVRYYSWVQSCWLVVLAPFFISTKKFCEAATVSSQVLPSLSITNTLYLDAVGLFTYLIFVDNFCFLYLHTHLAHVTDVPTVGYMVRHF